MLLSVRLMVCPAAFLFLSQVAKLSSPWLWQKQIQTETWARRHLQNTQAAPEDLLQHGKGWGCVHQVTQGLWSLPVQRLQGRAGDDNY